LKKRKGQSSQSRLNFICVLLHMFVNLGKTTSVNLELLPLMQLSYRRSSGNAISGYLQTSQSWLCSYKRWLKCVVVPITVIENTDWIVLAIFLAIFCYDPGAIRATCIHVNRDGHPENMGAHEQFRFSPPSMRFSHLSHVALKISFKEPFSVSSSLDKLISHFRSKLVSQFLLGAVAGWLLSSPQACAVSNGPKQASAVPCDSWNVKVASP